MSFTKKISSCFLILNVFFCLRATAVEIDCQRPPQLVDPALCCHDGGRDSVADNCAKRFGLTGQPNDPPPTVQTATCLAQCILTDSGYITAEQKLDFDAIKNDLQKKFSNDSVYVETMFEAFTKCEPSAQNRLKTFTKIPLSSFGLQRGCSPLSGMLLGCAYMEYFKNCPANRWTESKECALAKQFVSQCGLGA